MMKELEEIVNRLESEDLSLEESIELFQRGVELYKSAGRSFRKNS